MPQTGQNIRIWAKFGILDPLGDPQKSRSDAMDSFYSMTLSI